MSNKTSELIPMIPKERRVAAFFLASEVERTDTDLFSYSQSFYAQHRELLPHDFGVVSIHDRPEKQEEHDQPDEGRESRRECIAFDARGADTGEFTWEFSFPERGAQRVVRLQALAGGLAGSFIETSVQGAVVNSFELSPEITEAVKDRLLESLGSPEVEETIAGVYAQRRNLEKAIVTLGQEKADAANDRWYNPKVFDQLIDSRERLLAECGFSPLVLFELKRLENFRPPA